MKHYFGGLTGPTQFVRATNIFAKKILLKIPPATSPKLNFVPKRMTCMHNYEVINRSKGAVDPMHCSLLLFYEICA